MKTDLQERSSFQYLGLDRSMRAKDLSPTKPKDYSDEKHDSARRHRAAMLIQQCYQHADAIYRGFGPAVLCRKYGRPSNYGNIHFSEVNTKSKFVVISDTTSAARLSKFVEKYWGVHKPEVIISVTGSAQNFQLNPILQNAFDKGLAAAASSAGTWIITGGTDGGVMKLVAESLRQSGVEVPLIGVAPFGAVAHADDLEDVQVKIRRFQAPLLITVAARRYACFAESKDSISRYRLVESAGAFGAGAILELFPQLVWCELYDMKDCPKKKDGTTAPPRCR